MGSGIGFSCGSSNLSNSYGGPDKRGFGAGTIQPPNPNPYKYKIRMSVAYNNHWMVMIRYEGCTTFDGDKLMIMNVDPYTLNSIDPHFLTEQHYVIARFQPNNKGFKLAKIVIKQL